MQPEPIFDLAHLGHMELLTPKPDESLKFFVDVMGMTISGRKGESVFEAVQLEANNFVIVPTAQVNQLALAAADGHGPSTSTKEFQLSSGFGVSNSMWPRWARSKIGSVA